MSRSGGWVALVIQSALKRDQMTQSAASTVLGVSRSHLCDVMKGRKMLSVSAGAAWAKALRLRPEAMLTAVIQDQLDAAGLRFWVSVHEQVELTTGKPLPAPKRKRVRR